MPFNSREFDSVKAAVSRDTYRQEQHPDDAAVDALAAAMKAKLAKQRENGYGGWDTPEFTQQRLSEMLRAHVDKGDPVDVANFCAFLAARGEGIAQAAQWDAEDAARSLFDAGWKACAKLCDRDDVIYDGIVGSTGCPQFENAFDAVWAAQQDKS